MARVPSGYGYLPVSGCSPAKPQRYVEEPTLIRSMYDKVLSSYLPNGNDISNDWPDTYQANRLKCRYRSADKKTELCHTLNGSALALPRIVAALLENNQTPEGIRIPKALVPYCGFDMID